MIALIESVNPKWDDLSREWGMPINFEEIIRNAEEFQNQDPSTRLRLARDDNRKRQEQLKAAMKAAVGKQCS
jgi:hypothetical protein